MKPARFVIPAAIIVMSIFLASCGTTRKLGKNEFLLKKNEVKFQGKNPGIDAGEITTIIQPKPNQKFLGLFPLKLQMYMLGYGGKKDTKFRKWLMNKAGERPVLYDSATSKESVKDVGFYLKKIGYFESKVSVNAVHLKKKKIAVVYTINAGPAYHIRKIDYLIEDTLLRRFALKDQELSKLKAGNNFNAFQLEDERDRITELLLENGYYNFNRNYIYYEIDSSLANHEMDITVRIKDDQEPIPDSAWLMRPKPHKRFFYNKIYIQTDLNANDTLIFDIRQIRKDRPVTRYYFLYRDRLVVHPKTISQSVFMLPGDPYNIMDIKKSKLRFSEVGLFSYANIRFKEVPGNDSAVTKAPLDCYIDLSKRKLHSFTFETQVTNSAGSPGIGLGLTYQHNNLFRGSEIFRIKVYGGIEAQKSLSDTTTVSGGNPFFNTIQAGTEVGIDFPRFLIPVRQERFPKYFRPKTTLSVSFGYEKRPEYKRIIQNLSFGYNWKQSEQMRHILLPFDISMVWVNNSPSFQKTIDNEPNNLVKNQYTNHLITAIRYSFIFNNQDIRKLRNFMYFRTNVETAGNLVYLVNSLAGTPPSTNGYYTLFGIRYSQYVRVDGDLRFYNVISRNTTLAYRLYLGVGIPYANAVALPLEKGFYGGGANGMRGWRLRTLGPGSYSNPADNFDRMGDLQMEANIEYRFPVWRFFKLGLFADAGNIWLWHENSSYPGGQFQVSNFVSEIALDAGLGIRLDFNFFIFRIDGGVIFKDPSHPAGDRWVIDKFQFKKILWNFGIGYPF